MAKFEGVVSVRGQNRHGIGSVDLNSQLEPFMIVADGVRLSLAAFDWNGRARSTRVVVAEYFSSSHAFSSFGLVLAHRDLEHLP